MLELKYNKQFVRIISDLDIDLEKGEITTYDYNHIKSYLIKIHNSMRINGKRNLFRYLDLALSENIPLRSKYELYAYYLVAKKFHKRKIIRMIDNII